MSAKVLVRKYGEMWARNKTNIGKVPGSKEGGKGVYVLYDGSMPVYIGKGNIHSRIRGANRSKKRREFWDYFSWYAIADQSLIHDIEALLLRRLPWYLRGLNQQSGKFINAQKANQTDSHPRSIARKATA